MDKILVTGGAGFIGSAVAKRLIDLGYDVFTIDNLSTGKVENIPEKCPYIIGDVFSESVLADIEKYRFNAIIHIAGQSSGEVSFENPIYDLNTNTKSTLLLLELARKTGCKKFIYASSMAVYGEHEEEFVDEDSVPCPKSFYAVGKLASENYMRIFSTYGIQCTALRFFNVYGIGQNMDNLKQGMFSIYLAQALKNRHIVVKGSKDRFRDFVYIDDIVDSVLLALQRTSGNAFEIFNVSSGKKRTVEELIEFIKEKLSGEFAVTAEYIEGTPGDQHGIYGDNKKIYDMLGWIPKIDFEKGATMMIDWAIKEGGAK